MTEHDIDDLTKSRILAEMDETIPGFEALRDVVLNLRGKPMTAAQQHMVRLGLEQDAIDDGRLEVISSTLGYVSGRCYDAGLSRTDMTQILAHVWHQQGDEPIGSYFRRAALFVNARGLSAPTRDLLCRKFRWCLDEMHHIVSDRSNIPALAWFMIEIMLDIVEQIMPRSG